MKQGDRSGTSAPRLPGTTRVQEQHAAHILNRRPVRVTANNGAKAGRRRLYVKSIHVMKHIQQDVAELNDLCLREIMRPIAIVHVSSHGDNGRDRSQRFKYIRFADVSSMNDQVGAFQRLESRRWQETVCVRDDTDQEIVLVLECW